MNLSPAALFIGVIAGAFGVGYFVYGKKQHKIVPMLSGALLCIYPFMFESTLWLTVVGLALVAAPFLIDL